MRRIRADNIKRIITAGLRLVEQERKAVRPVPEGWLSHLAKLKAEVKGEPSPTCGCELCQVVN